MFLFVDIKLLKTPINNMKHNEAPLMKAPLLEQSRQLGARLARLRTARKLRQVDAALRAGISRSTAIRIEQGDPGPTLGQVLRYLDAVAPGATLLSLLLESDPALQTLAAAGARQRVRVLSNRELAELEF